jgi:hypothetical protein
MGSRAQAGVIEVTQALVQAERLLEMLASPAGTTAFRGLLSAKAEGKPTAPLGG